MSNKPRKIKALQPHELTHGERRHLAEVRRHQNTALCKHAGSKRLATLIAENHRNS